MLPQMPPFAGKEWQSWKTSFQDGLCYMTYKTRQGFEHCVSSYEDRFNGDWKGTLRIPVTVARGRRSELSIDEASGRVMI